MSQQSKFTNWHKSSWSSGGDNCVEVAYAPDGSVGVRDSKSGDGGPVLDFTAAEWQAFIRGVKGHEFDRA